MIGVALLLAFVFVQNSSPPDRDGVISGEVRSFDGTPASGLRVAAMVADVGAETLSSIALTDAAGHYRLAAAPPGRYYIVAGALETPTYFPGVSKPSSAQTVTVAAGAVVTGMDFTLRRLSAVSGRVNGLPPSTARGALSVRLQSSVDFAGRPVEVPVETDGTFKFPNVPGGDYFVSLVLAFSTTLVAIHVDEADVGDITITPPPLIPGRVVIEGGGAVPAPSNRDSQTWFRLAARSVHETDVTLSLDGVRFENATYQAVVQADGSFVLALPAGEFFVEMDQMVLGYDVKSIAYGRADALKDFVKVDAGGNSAESILVTLTTSTSGVKVSGRVVGLEAVAGRSLQIEARTMSSWTGAMTRVGAVSLGADGSFEFLDVPSGLLTIAVSGKGLSRTIDIRDQDVTGIELGAVRISKPTTPGGATAETIRAVDEVGILSLPFVGNDPLALIATLPGRRATPLGNPCPCVALVSGRLTGAQPLPTRIRLVNERTKTEFESAVDAKGAFYFDPVPWGVYAVKVLPAEAFPAALPNLNVQRFLKDLDIPVRALHNIVGRVVLEGGARLPDLSRSVVSVEGGGRAPVQSDGRFSILLPEGEYTVSVLNLPDGYAVKTITLGLTELRDGLLKIDGPPTAEVRIGIRPAQPTTERK